MREEEIKGYDPLWCDYCGMKDSEYQEYKKKEEGLKEGECPVCKMLTPEQIKKIEEMESMMFESCPEANDSKGGIGTFNKDYICRNGR